jgi:hypothetical protein
MDIKTFNDIEPISMLLDEVDRDVLNKNESTI